MPKPKIAIKEIVKLTYKIDIAIIISIDRLIINPIKLPIICCFILGISFAIFDIKVETLFLEK